MLCAGWKFGCWAGTRKAIAVRSLALLILFGMLTRVVTGVDWEYDW